MCLFVCALFSNVQEIMKSPCQGWALNKNGWVIGWPTGKYVDENDVENDDENYEWASQPMAGQ